jgi:hypothetical protein
VLLESRALLGAKPRTAIILAVLWCGALTGFALATAYPLALALLFTAGFFELAFNAMAQTLVQLDAPAEIRGRVIGLFNMASILEVGGSASDLPTGGRHGRLRRDHNADRVWANKRSRANAFRHFRHLGADRPDPRPAALHFRRLRRAGGRRGDANAVP